MNRYNFANDKFSEAQFFLRLMNQNIEDVQHFRYYLSAFLSASRTVLLIWTHEKKKNERFWNWFNQVFEKVPLLKFLKDARDDNSHEGKLVLATGDLYSIEMIEVIDGRHIPRGSIKTSIMSPEQIDKFIERNHPEARVIKLSRYRWKFGNLPRGLFSNDDVIEVAEEILGRLSQFLIMLKYEFPELC